MQELKITKKMGDRYDIDGLLPRGFDPTKHQVVMIDRETERVVCIHANGGGLWVPVEDAKSKPEPRKYHNEYCLYLAYFQSLKLSNGICALEYYQWEKDWEQNNDARQEAILQQYANLAGYSCKPLSSLQESVQGEAFNFALYVSPRS